MKQVVLETEQGFSLIELLIVITISVTALVTIGVKIGPAVVSLDIETVTAEVVENISRARRAALAGEVSTATRTFDLNKAVSGRHGGIVVSSSAPAVAAICEGTCPGQQSICVSGRRYCYTVGNSFSFERHSGRLSQGQALFILSNSRKFALLLDREGHITFAELHNGQWRTNTDLQRLALQNQ